MAICRSSKDYLKTALISFKSLAGLRPNSEILGNFGILKNFFDKLVQHQNWSLHTNFEVRRRQRRRETSKNVLKMVSGQSTLKNEFFPKIFFSSYGAFKTTCSYFFLGRNIHWVALESVLKIFTKNLQSATKCIKYQDIHIFRNKIWFSIRICQNFWDPPTQIFIFSNISKTRGQNFLTKNSNSA